MSKWVLIDLSVLAYKAMYTMGDLAHEDIPTGVIFGFFEQLYEICTSAPVRSNKVLIFADSRKSYRKKVFPGYKKRPPLTEEEQEQKNIMYKQINKLKNKILPKLGFPVFKQVGLESDDLIAHASQELTQRKKHGIIITSDQDLYQCITPYIKWYDPGKELLMDEEAFKNEYGIPPSEWHYVKALAGCTSDKVPGVKGVGEKGAIQYIKKEMPRNKKFTAIVNAELSGEVRKWLELVNLPHGKTRMFWFGNTKVDTPKYKPKLFFSFCQKYNIISYLQEARASQWIRFFKGEFKGKVRRRKRK